jgi:sugar phosphate isomerase/epimerase
LNNPADRELSKRFGISTFWCPSADYSFEDALRAIRDAGFDTLEIVPCDYQTVPGQPEMKSIGLDPTDLSTAEKKALIRLFRTFGTITVHAPHRDLNLASANRGIREETARQYRQVLQFALDIDASRVTFHHGHQTFRTKEPDSVIADRNIAFGFQALELSEGHSIALGYEVGNFDILARTIDGIGNERFGVLLDLGHTGRTENAMRFLSRFEGKIVEVHLHGTKIDDHGTIHAHEPLSRNTLLDFHLILPELKRQGFEGPFICEILSKDLPAFLEDSRESRDTALDIWTKST